MAAEASSEATTKMPTIDVEMETAASLTLPEITLSIRLSMFDSISAQTSACFVMRPISNTGLMMSKTFRSCHRFCPVVAASYSFPFVYALSVDKPIVEMRVPLFTRFMTGSKGVAIRAAEAAIPAPIRPNCCHS